MDYKDFMQYEYYEKPSIFQYPKTNIFNTDIFYTFIYFMVFFTVMSMYSSYKNNEVDDIYIEMKTQMEKIDELEKKLFNKETLIDEYKTKITNYEKTITDLNNQINSLNNQLNNKEFTINKLKNRQDTLCESFNEYLKNNKNKYNLRERKIKIYPKVDIDTDTSDSDYDPEKDK